jgi:FixJ family two-component response regulator
MNNSNNATILIVDDDASVRRGIERLLKSAGYNAETFSNGKDFLAVKKEYEEPACLVLDVKMPGKNGLDLQEEIALYEIPIPIVFISGHGDIATSVKAMKNGAVDFLPKPFEDEDLLSAISAALERDLNMRAAVIESKKILQRFELLTPREYEIMTFVISGMLNKQIAAALNISEKTVKVHRARVYTKIGVISVAELVRLAEKVGIRPATVSI